MWSALFGRIPYQSTAPMDFQKEQEASSAFVYLIDGDNRIPIPLPDEQICGDFTRMRQWVFEIIARLPNDEDIEAYTFKVLPDGYIYWYNASFKLGVGEEEETYGILVKYDPEERRFTSIQDGELPVIPRQKRVIPKIVRPIENTDNNNNTSPHPLKRNKNKRSRK